MSFCAKESTPLLGNNLNYRQIFDKRCLEIEGSEKKEPVAWLAGLLHKFHLIVIFT